MATLPPDEQAREFLSPYFEMLDALGPAKMNREVHSAKLAALLARVRLETARKLEGMPCGEYDDGSRAAYITELERQAAGEGTK